jgi:ATP-dependent DNA ligase
MANGFDKDNRKLVNMLLGAVAIVDGQERRLARYLRKGSACWLKIKPVRPLPCVVIGWQPR